jgi:chaperone modulatory protein CbpM|tara:strand:+ start:894 stop:1187 length:294 start_codon:yes stop_codon:yes gene_type:complete
MDTQLIQLNDFCSGHEIEVSFVTELHNYDIIEIKIIDNNQFITIEELPKVEKMIRLHQDLQINIEGLEAINQLLQRNIALQNEIRLLRQKINRLDDF